MEKPRWAWHNLGMKRQKRNEEILAKMQEVRDTSIAGLRRLGISDEEVQRLFPEAQAHEAPITKAPKRPRDLNQCAKRMLDIATGEASDREPTPQERGVDPAASAMGKRGGPARAASMTPERRAEIAKKAAAKRWHKG